jgi:hypothetical protein
MVDEARAVDLPVLTSCPDLLLGVSIRRVQANPDDVPEGQLIVAQRLIAGVEWPFRNTVPEGRPKGRRALSRPSGTGTTRDIAYPAMNRWAILMSPSGAEVEARVTASPRKRGGKTVGCAPAHNDDRWRIRTLLIIVR